MHSIRYLALFMITLTVTHNAFEAASSSSAQKEKAWKQHSKCSDLALRGYEYSLMQDYDPRIVKALQQDVQRCWKLTERMFKEANKTPNQSKIQR